MNTFNAHIHAKLVCLQHQQTAVRTRRSLRTSSLKGAEYSPPTGDATSHYQQSTSVHTFPPISDLAFPSFFCPSATLLRTLQMPLHLHPLVASAFASFARDLSPGFRAALPSFAWRSLSEVWPASVSSFSFQYIPLRSNAMFPGLGL